MFSISSIMAIFGAVTELIQKGRPAIEGLIALLGQHDIKVRDEAIAKMLLESDAALQEIEAEIAARAARVPGSGLPGGPV